MTSNVSTTTYIWQTNIRPTRDVYGRRQTSRLVRANFAAFTVLIALTLSFVRRNFHKALKRHLDLQGYMLAIAAS